jgi:cell division protein FtsL
MGEAARKLSHEVYPAPSGARLRVVKSRTRDPRARAATSSARAHSTVKPHSSVKPHASSRPAPHSSASTARAVFTVFVWVAIGVAAVGMVRVGIMARVAEMSLTEGSLRSSIKSERAAAGQLEVDKSSLMAPSRVESIASATMQMTQPVSVNYLLLPPDPRTQANGAVATASAGGSAGGVARAGATGVGGVISAVLDMSAGEAQSLLVGDVGLAGSR